MADIVAGFYYAYMICPFLTKLIVMHYAVPGSHYFPSTFILEYSLYQQKISNDGTEYSLTKHFGLTHYQSVIAVCLLLAASSQAEWIQLAHGEPPQGNCFRWVRHWDLVIPDVEEGNERVIVKLYFAQFMMRNRAMTLRTEFDKQSKEIISVDMGFCRLNQPLQYESDTNNN